MPEEVNTPAEPTSAEQTQTVETPAVESKTEVTSDLLNSDGFVNKVADAVFDRMKNFTGSLVEAQQAAQEIAANMLPVETPPPEGGAPVDPNTPPPPDQAPMRRHSMFKQPFKNRQQ